MTIRQMAEFDEIFSRNIIFWGKEKQRLLSQSIIVIAGVGGLGCVVAEILVRAGIKKLILIDNKEVDMPDLNRQALYSFDDLGKSKLDVASQKLTSFTHQTEIIPLHVTINEDDFPEIIAQYTFDGIADCLDNYHSRFALENILNDDLFLVHGGVQGDYGQVTTIIKNRTPLLKDLYTSAEEASSPIPVCPQIVFCIGSLMALEIQKNLWGTPELLNKLLIVELSDFSFSKIQLAPSA